MDSTLTKTISYLTWRRVHSKYNGEIIQDLSFPFHVNSLKE